MICDNCDYEYEIGEKGSYVNIYGTRCPKCKHLIKPDELPKFIREKKEQKKDLAMKFLPLIMKKLLKK